MIFPVLFAVTWPECQCRGASRSRHRSLLSRARNDPTNDIGADSSRFQHVPLLLLGINNDFNFCLKTLLLSSTRKEILGDLFYYFHYLERFIKFCSFSIIERKSMFNVGARGKCSQLSSTGDRIENKHNIIPLYEITWRKRQRSIINIQYILKRGPLVNIFYTAFVKYWCNLK